MQRENPLGKQGAEPIQGPAPAHGGDLHRAMALFGGEPGEWLDLSTGINALPWPLRPSEAETAVWSRLPDRQAADAAAEAARTAYGAPPSAAVLPTAGAQAAIQTLPRVLKAAFSETPRAAILSPTYAEHAHAFEAAAWRVEEIGDLAQAVGAEAAVVVHPNNPDGRRHALKDLLRLAEQVGTLIIDESFADETPEHSLAGACGATERLIVLRSLGKFYGLAGLRLGFAIGAPGVIERLSAALGPWPVSGPALHFGAAALRDRSWAEHTRQRLALNGPRLRAMGEATGLTAQGGTGLFQSFLAPDAAALQTALARRRIWTRIWPERPGWVRFGAPGSEADWSRLQSALEALAAPQGRSA